MRVGVDCEGLVQNNLKFSESVSLLAVGVGWLRSEKSLEALLAKEL